MTVHAASSDLHDALIRALAPVTRWLHPAAGDGDAELVNPAGVDVWDGQVGSARVDPDGTVHAYLFVQDTPGGSRQTRQVKEGTVLTYRPLVTVATRLGRLERGPPETRGESAPHLPEPRSPRRPCPLAPFHRHSNRHCPTAPTRR
mgnify:CR=1 FL=1